MTISFEDHEKLMKAKRAARKAARLVDEVLEGNPHDPPPWGDLASPYLGLKQVADLNVVADWHHKLIENGNIRDTVQGIRYIVPPSTSRVRCELQFARDTQPIPGTNAYRMLFTVPETCKIGTDQRGKSGGATIMQTHTDVDDAHGGGYSGGLALRPNGELVWRVTGNKDQGEDVVFVLGIVQPEQVHEVVVRADWGEGAEGNARAWFDSKLVLEATQIATVPRGATTQKYRNGWYADPSHGLDLIVHESEVWGK